MDRRTFESPMEWEYQNAPAVDLTSPFARVARSNSQNIFNSPSKFTAARPNPFANFNSPARPPQPASQSQPHPPQTSIFSPKVQPGSAAPPFRNPAFTTPRKPFDEHVFSEASGAETSPALTDTSTAAPNDSPDVDRLTDLMGTITPSRVDKNLRYGSARLHGAGISARKHVAGRGEIARAGSSAVDVLRKRKRHNLDRDVGSVRLYGRQEWEGSEADESDTDGNARAVSSPRKTSRPPIFEKQQHEQQKRGWLRSIFSVMDDHPNAPDNIYAWVRLLINSVMFSVFLLLVWLAFDTVRTDVRTANEAARAELAARILQCQTNYVENHCAKREIPALRATCDEWFECMNQDPGAIMRVKVSVRQVADVLNEFAGAMNLKAWGLFLSVLLVTLLANNLSRGGGGGGHAAAAAAMPPPPPTPSHPAGSAAHFDPGYAWMEVNTPHRRRLVPHVMDDAGTDGDESPPVPMRAITYTPSGRRSPTKRDVMQSPSKGRRSPQKFY